MYQKLRKPQIESLKQMKLNKKGILQLCCGSGKSEIINQAIIKSAVKQILLIMPLQILHQYAQKYMINGNIQTYIISGEFLFRKSEINDLIMQVLPANVNQIPYDSAIKSVTMITYASAHKLLQFAKKSVFDLIIFDEAHHATADSILPLIKIFAKNSSIQCYFFTATPNIKQQTGKNSNIYTFNMYHNTQLYGKILYEYDLYQALKDKIVCNYKVLFRAYLKQKGQSIEHTQLEQIIMIAINNKRKRVIIYNRYSEIDSKKHTTSNQFQKLSNINFIKDNKIKVYICQISGNTNQQQKNAYFSEFMKYDTTIKIICNVNCISEGTNLPITDMIVFCDDKQSKIQIIQSIGRGIRMYQYPNKKFKQNCLITCMLQFDSPHDFLKVQIDEEVQRNRYKIIKFIVRSLINQDIRMQQIMENSRYADQQMLIFSNDKDLAQFKKAMQYDKHFDFIPLLSSSQKRSLISNNPLNFILKHNIYNNFGNIQANQYHFMHNYSSSNSITQHYNDINVFLQQYINSAPLNLINFSHLFSVYQSLINNYN